MKKRKNGLDGTCAWCEKPCQRASAFCSSECGKKWLECAVELKKRHKEFLEKGKNGVKKNGS